MRKAPTVDPEATFERALEPQFQPIRSDDLMNACSRANWDEEAKSFKENTCYAKMEDKLD